MMVRIVICIDTDHADADAAYQQVYKTMADTGLEWESSDEWFDVDGDPIPEEAVQECRERVFHKITIPATSGLGGHNDLRGS